MRTNEMNEMLVMNEGSGEMMNFEGVLAVADRAEKMVSALNKIMAAAIKITTPQDWCIIGGTPYLQESGATKVARLFGIGWQILSESAVPDEEGYPTYTYRMRFTMGGASIECDGSRSARDDFFAGPRTDKNGDLKKQKAVDAIPLRNVKMGAYTNCLNNGIKRILPGLRNLDIATLERGGIDTKKLKGYTFKEGSRGGVGKSAVASGLYCADCKASITQAEASYSEGRYQRQLCRGCQAKAKSGELAPVIDVSPIDVPPVLTDGR